MIDDKLMRQAMRALGAKTKREAVQKSLELMVRLNRQEQMRQLRGKLHWEGNLREMRRNRLPDW